MTTEFLYEEIKKLPPLEKVELIEKILSDFTLPERQDVDAAWADESERRISEYEKGNLLTRSADDVFDSLR